MQSFYLAGNKFLLEDFIGFNDSQNNSFVVKRVLKLLNQHLRITMQLIKVKNIKSLKIKSKYFEETNEISIPYDLNTNKMQEKIDLFINKQTFRNRYMQKIENNIGIINKLLYDDNKSIMFAAKWISIPFRIFVKHFKQYLRWIYVNL